MRDRMVGRKRSLVSWRAEQRTRKCSVSSGPELHNIQVGSTSSLLNLERLDCSMYVPISSLDFILARPTSFVLGAT